MASEECGWRIPGAYPVSKEDYPRQPMVASSSAHTWAHTTFLQSNRGATANAAEGFDPCAYPNAFWLESSEYVGKKVSGAYLAHIYFQTVDSTSADLAHT